MNFKDPESQIERFILLNSQQMLFFFAVFGVWYIILGLNYIKLPCFVTIYLTKLSPEHSLSGNLRVALVSVQSLYPVLVLYTETPETNRNITNSTIFAMRGSASTDFRNMFWPTSFLHTSSGSVKSHCFFVK